jgi:predicted nucleotide-binding protein (sugar kinase/HSP70/actin superfamily)
VVGEIYVRCDPFANDFLIEKLAKRGIRARLAPFNEWMEYSDLITKRECGPFTWRDRLSSLVQSRIQNRTYEVVAERLGWGRRSEVPEALEAVQRYLRTALRGEAVLTLGAPLHEWRTGAIQGVVSVGPLECMPNKIAEAQFFHAAEQEGLLTLTLPVNGDPIDAEVLDNFAFEIHSRFQRTPSRGPGAQANKTARPPRLSRMPAVSGSPGEGCSNCLSGRPAGI